MPARVKCPNELIASLPAASYALPYTAVNCPYGSAGCPFPFPQVYAIVGAWP